MYKFIILEYNFLFNHNILYLLIFVFYLILEYVAFNICIPFNVFFGILVSGIGGVVPLIN